MSPIDPSNKMFLKYLSLQINVTESAEARKCVSTPYRGVGGSHPVRDIPINNQQEVMSSRHACKSVDVNAAPQIQTNKNYCISLTRS